MACNRHKERRNGAVVPVLKGLAKDVEVEIGKLNGIISISFQFVSKHNGKSKVKIGEPSGGEFQVTVCDNEHGKSLLTVKIADAFAGARDLTSGLKKQRIPVA